MGMIENLEKYDDRSKIPSSGFYGIKIPKYKTMQYSKKD